MPYTATVESIRARHDPLCSGWCDVAVLLAAVDQRSAWAALWKSYAARLRRRLRFQWQRNDRMHAALLRARDELEHLTGEPQPWIDAAIVGQAPAAPKDRPLSVGEWAELRRQVGG